MARVAGQPTLSQQARSLFGTAGNGLRMLRSLNTDLFGPSTSRYLDQGLGGLGMVGGGLGVYNALNSNGNDAQKALGAASGLLQGVQGAGQLTGAYSVPYADWITAALNVGNIAASDMSDEAKAYNSANAAGTAALSATFGPAGALAGMTLGALGNQLLFDSPYNRKRIREAGMLGQLAPSYFNDIRLSPDQASLDSIFNVPGRIGLTRTGNGIGVRGVHFPVAGLEQQFSDAYAQQQGLFAAAAANPGGPEAQYLARLGPLRQQMDADFTTFEEALGGMPSPKEAGVFVLGGRLIPTNLNDHLTERLGQWVMADQRRGVDPADNPLTSNLADAMLRAGLDPIADAQRLWQRSQTIIGSHGEGSTDTRYDPAGVASAASAEALLSYLGAPIPTLDLARPTNDAF